MFFNAQSTISVIAGLTEEEQQPKHPNKQTPKRTNVYCIIYRSCESTTLCNIRKNNDAKKTHLNKTVLVLKYRLRIFKTLTQKSSTKTVDGEWSAITLSNRISSKPELALTCLRRVMLIKNKQKMTYFSLSPVTYNPLLRP